ncbi:hypothetical protein M413DRAFT_22554 [Hebeloma cylindrosporum]|uniref:WW domain-containing protein n=1 Tax=Hebeloma cylindrosporum TaxID=76867 RepID=A0A0C2YDW7_HEBCY|nr:hypothetical protein M413DRAFT_22554 [Hebeloma cylindrosporum h7]
MQASATNPDSRPLPDGWTEHFDSQRTIWYYVDLNSEPPRVTFVHPCDGTLQPLSAPIPEMGRLSQIRSSQRLRESRGITSPQSRRATVAQLLYASSISSSQASTSSSLLWADGVPSSADCPSPVPPSLLSSRPRPMPDSGSQLVLESDKIAPFTANAFYHHSVGTPPLFIPRTSSAKDVLETDLRTAPFAPKKDHHPKPYFDALSSPPPNVHPSLPSSSMASYFPNSNLYTATTEDNVMVMPTSRTTDQAPNENWKAPIDVSCLSDSHPLPVDRFHNTRNIATLDDQNIIVQPKPTRPLNGVSLNLQAQVAGDIPLSESVKHVKAKRKVPLKNFASKNPFSKGRTVTNTSDDCQESTLNSDKDESYVFVEILQLGTTST